MKNNRFNLLLRTALFWFLFFEITRFLFLAFNSHQLKEISSYDILYTVVNGFRMDLATICYHLAITFIFLYFFAYGKKYKSLIDANKYFTYFLISLNTLIIAVDAALYKAWGTKLNVYGLGHLKYPKEVAAQSVNMQNLDVLIALPLLIVFFIFLYNRLFKISEYDFKIQKTYNYIGFFILTAGFIFLGIRGGLQTRPIDKSWVFHTNKPVLNYAALNSFWNFFEIFSKPAADNGNYYYYNEKIVNAEVGNLNNPGSEINSFTLTNIKKPNIILVFWESAGADVFGALNGEKDVTPLFDSLCKEGILFTNFLSSGFRTDQGLVATLSGFPAQPKTSIITEYGKFEKLPNLITELRAQGYYSNYIYAGNSAFANTATYLKAAGINNVTDQKNMTIKRRTIWGALDEELFDYHISHFTESSQPFFTILPTITSHENFDAPVTKIFKEGDMGADYRNTMHYTDSCFYNYVKRLQRMPEYNNTLIIIMGDHGHQQPKGRSPQEIRLHHIPFLITGGALNKDLVNKTCGAHGSQIDFPAFILDQLNLNTGNFLITRDFTKADNNVGYYAYDNGFGIINKTDTFIYDCNSKMPVYKSKNSSEIERKGKCLLQYTIKEYNELIRKQKLK